MSDTRRPSRTPHSGSTIPRASSCCRLGVCAAQCQSANTAGRARCARRRSPALSSRTANRGAVAASSNARSLNRSLFRSTDHSSAYALAFLRLLLARRKVYPSFCPSFECWPALLGAQQLSAFRVSSHSRAPCESRRIAHSPLSTFCTWSMRNVTALPMPRLSLR